MHKRSLFCVSNEYLLVASPMKRHVAEDPRFGFTAFVMRVSVNGAFEDDLLEFSINLKLECKPHFVFTKYS